MTRQGRSKSRRKAADACLCFGPTRTTSESNPPPAKPTSNESRTVVKADTAPAVTSSVWQTIFDQLLSDDEPTQPPASLSTPLPTERPLPPPECCAASKPSPAPMASSEELPPPAAEPSWEQELQPVELLTEPPTPHDQTFRAWRAAGNAAIFAARATRASQEAARPASSDVAKQESAAVTGVGGGSGGGKPSARFAEEPPKLGATAKPSRKSFSKRRAFSLASRPAPEPQGPDTNSIPLDDFKELEIMEQIAKIRLRGIDNQTLRAEMLWQGKPAVLLLLRRPGCVTCRAESLKLEQIAGRLDALGVRRVAVVHEWLEAEIKAYCDHFWSGEVYLDPGREFYKVIGGGEIRQGKMSDFLKPGSRLWKNIATARVVMKGQPSNFKGDFMTLGGLIIVRADAGGVQYMFREEVFGDPLRIKLILDECVLAASHSARRGRSIELENGAGQKLSSAPGGEEIQGGVRSKSLPVASTGIDRAALAKGATSLIAESPKTEGPKLAPTAIAREGPELIERRMQSLGGVQKNAVKQHQIPHEI